MYSICIRVMQEDSTLMILQMCGRHTADIVEHPEDMLYVLCMVVSKHNPTLEHVSL